MQITTNKSLNEAAENDVIITDEMKRKYPELKNVNMIQKVPYTREVHWNTAMKYAKDLKLAGYSDWRLPNVYEASRIAKIFGKEMKLTWRYWTSTERGAYCVTKDGNIYYGITSTIGYCFCVR